jgi:ATP-binding cassette, subfamily B, multidrug efflux pump
MINRILTAFERWIDPYKPGPSAPPATALAYLRHFVVQAPGAFAIMLVVGGLIALLEAALFWFVGRLVDLLDAAPKDAGWQGLIAGNGPELFGMLLVVLVVRTAVIALAAMTEEQAVVPGFFNMVRWQGYARISRQSVSFFNDDFSGRIATKVWQGGQAVGDLMVSMLQVVWFVIIYSVSTVLLVGSLDWRLGAMVLVWIIAFAFAANHFLPRVRAASKAAAEAGAMVQGRLVDAFGNIETLKLLGRDSENDAYVRDGFDRFRNAILPFTRLLTGVRVTLATLSGLMMAAIAWMSIDLWLAGSITVGAVAFTLGLVLRLNLLLARLMTQLNGLMRNFGTMQNAMEMIAKPIDLEDKRNAVMPKPLSHAITLDAVGFHYGRGSGVIDDLTLSFKAGVKTALVGPSGAGKSTIIKLLLRLHDAEKGRVLFDGADVRDLKQAGLRAHFSVVTQEPGLLNRSIRDNILFGRPDASFADVEAAARKASAHEFILALKDAKGRTGYDAHVGERGVKLSGGQRQRIAIARALLRDAPILVLDEATSSLDSEIEAAIQDNLAALTEGKTVIAIAHRLSTISRMDRLVILDRGAIVEDGTHDDLLAGGGLYARLWRRQSGGFLALAAE